MSAPQQKSRSMRCRTGVLVKTDPVLKIYLSSYLEQERNGRTPQTYLYNAQEQSIDGEHLFLAGSFSAAQIEKGLVHVVDEWMHHNTFTEIEDEENDNAAGGNDTYEDENPQN